MKAKLIKEDKHFVLFTGTRFISTTDFADGTTNKLSLKNCQEIERGYDLDELAKKFTEDESYGELNGDLFKGYIFGFQKCLKLLGDKKFSEEDMYKIFIYGRSIDTAKKYIKKVEDKPINEFFEEFIQSLQQTEWDVEICCYVEEDDDTDSFISPMLTNTGIPKLDSEGCLILKLKSE